MPSPPTQLSERRTLTNREASEAKELSDFKLDRLVTLAGRLSGTRRLAQCQRLLGCKQRQALLLSRHLEGIAHRVGVFPVLVPDQSALYFPR